ncbi:class I SAM-dependent methyltransferase [Mycobacteroides abscessus]|uniref:class I SAM-dependent methyltransferase n=1 Tax=Mycobacteroides abscessus TaxID=36809 RepID=UPI0012FFD71E|nr:class I SAM-dependent methyltransferase [Mycobacteroides abscessus]
MGKKLCPPPPLTTRGTFDMTVHHAENTIKKNILEISYPDFVGAIGQNNTPPGGRKTVHRWIDQASINRSSFVLDLACSTGFSGREAHRDTGARVHGVDTSQPAIDMARTVAKGSSLLTYQVADAAELPLSDGAFTHILAGCNFGFIQKREKALQESARVLRPGGFLCTSFFYYVDTPPIDLLNQVEEAIGYRPDSTRDYDYWIGFFGSKFELSNEYRSPLKLLRNFQISREVRRQVRKVPGLRGASYECKKAAEARLLGIRQVLNEHRRYQEVCISVWKRHDST